MAMTISLHIGQQPTATRMLFHTIAMKSFVRSIALPVLLAFALTAHAEKAKPFVFWPRTGAGPFPVVVWLHGYRGYSSEGYFPGASETEMQKHADALGAVIVGFPATTDLGDGTQQWSEDPVKDHQYIQSHLRSTSMTPNVDFSKVALFGFSQGAMVAADLASRYPESYLGALLMSPGGLGSSKVANARKPEHAKQVYFCFCGANEHPANVGLTKMYAKQLGDVLGAKVTLKLYPGVARHARPADFMEKFPDWMAAILKGNPPMQRQPDIR
jgi:predicted esterase